MITNNTYYKGEVFISQAKPSITDDTTGVNEDFLFILNKYEEECLIECLGYNLYKEFSDQLDSQKSTLIKDAADAKWGLLLNGHGYQDANSKTKNWKGIRSKMPLSSNTYNSSFLAYYVYIAYERKDYINNTSVGHVKEKVKNGVTVVPTQKIVNAWRQFYRDVQGEDTQSEYIIKPGFGYGVDYLNKNKIVSLYEYINDMNDLDEANFVDFEPKDWKNMNQFGL